MFSPPFPLSITVILSILLMGPATWDIISGSLLMSISVTAASPYLAIASARRLLASASARPFARIAPASASPLSWMALAFASGPDCLSVSLCLQPDHLRVRLGLYLLGLCLGLGFNAYLFRFRLRVADCLGLLGLGLYFGFAPRCLGGLVNAGHQLLFHAVGRLLRQGRLFHLGLLFNLPQGVGHVCFRLGPVPLRAELLHLQGFVALGLRHLGFRSQLDLLTFAGSFRCFDIGVPLALRFGDFRLGLGLGHLGTGAGFQVSALGGNAQDGVGEKL